MNLFQQAQDASIALAQIDNEQINTSMYSVKNEILGHLWEKYQLDSIQGQWDYIEPVVFGYAAGKVIESFVENGLTFARMCGIIGPDREIPE